MKWGTVFDDQGSRFDGKGNLRDGWSAAGRVAAHGVDITAKRDGFSGEQRFFPGWAQLWRTQTTEIALRAEIDCGCHSSARYRVNGVVRNLQAWYDAFEEVTSTQQ